MFKYNGENENEPLTFRWRDLAILVGWVGGVFGFIAFIKYAF